MSQIRIANVRLAAPRDTLGSLEDFYCGQLELRRRDGNAAALTVGIGPATLSFVAEPGQRQPFYHFAFLVPGDRFDAAYRWLQGRVQLLPIPESGTDTIDFESWNARACYFHDPVGNIVEFIAHQDLSRTPARTGDFSSDELAAISEIGLVAADPPATLDLLTARLGLPAWFGDTSGPFSLCFLGRQAHTLILSAQRRGWLPTGRPAELHPVAVTLTRTRTRTRTRTGTGTGAGAAQLSLPDGHQIRIQAPERDR